MEVVKIINVAIISISFMFDLCYLTKRTKCELIEFGIQLPWQKHCERELIEALIVNASYGK